MRSIYCFIVIMAVTCFSCSKDGGYYSKDFHESKFKGSVYDYLKSKPGTFDSLLSVVDRIQLDSILKDSAGITFFAPTNQSFRVALENLNNVRKLADRDAENYSGVDYDHLDTLVSYYLTRGALTTDSLTMREGRTLYDYKFNHAMHAKIFNSNASGYVGGGPKIIEFSDTKSSQFVRDWSTSLTGSVNIEANNGIVHVLTPEHVFGFDDFIDRMTYIPPPENLFRLYPFTFSVSREHSSGPDHHESSQYVFDGNPETKFLLGGFGFSEWMQVEFEESKEVNAYTLTSANDSPGRDPTDWMLQGSHDGESWTTLDSKNSEEFIDRFQERVFWINNTTAYKFYRLTILRLNDSGTFQLADWSVNYSDIK